MANYWYHYNHPRRHKSFLWDGNISVHYDGTVLLYDSVEAGDPDNPYDDHFHPPYGRDPFPTYEARLEALNAECYRVGRHPSQPPMTSTGEAVDWLQFRVKHRAYFVPGDLLILQCPRCHALAGQRCVNLATISTQFGSYYKQKPHEERVLWFEGREKHGLNTPEGLRNCRKPDGLRFG